MTLINEWAKTTSYLRHHLVPIKDLKDGVILCKTPSNTYYLRRPAETKDNDRSVPLEPFEFNRITGVQSEVTIGPYTYYYNFDKTTHAKYLTSMVPFMFHIQSKAKTKVLTILAKYHEYVHINQEQLKLFEAVAENYSSDKSEWLFKEV